MATLKLFQCQRPSCQPKNDGKFASEQPICPQCKLEANHPKYGMKIQRLVMIHFDPPSEFPGMGMNYRSCNREQSIQAPDGPGGVPNPWHSGTALPSAVTCPACKETADFKEALAISEDEDAPNLAKAAMGRLQPLAKVS